MSLFISTRKELIEGAHPNLGNQIEIDDDLESAR